FSSSFRKVASIDARLVLDLFDDRDSAFVPAPKDVDRPTLPIDRVGRLDKNRIPALPTQPIGGDTGETSVIGVDESVQSRPAPKDLRLEPGIDRSEHPSQRRHGGSA